MAKIIVDTMGADLGLAEVVKGCLEATSLDNTLELILVGPGEDITPLVEGIKQIKVIDAKEVITNLDNPMVAIREKQNASIVVALELLRSDESIDGLVTAGATGALICGSILKLKKLPGAKPALLASLIGKDFKPFCLVDCGANIDSPASFLVSFAKMGVSYMEACFGIKNPKVALLSNGAESTKGDARTKEAHQLLKETNLNFIGNVEASHVLDGLCDCVVCDGFSGNMILKNTEGTAKFILSSLIQKKNEVDEDGKKLLDEVIKDLTKQFDYNGLGGAVLVGFDKILIKGHGASNHTSIKNIIFQAVKMANGDIIHKMEQNL